MGEKNKVRVVVHMADIHIRTYRMHEEYKEIFTTFIERIKEQTKDFKHEEIRIAVVGDLVHQKITISNEQLILSCWFLNKLSEIGKVVLVAGNHDLLENNRDRMDSITPMIELLDNKNIVISAHGNSIRALCKFLFKLDNKRISLLEIPTGNPLLINLDSKLEITECKYLDKNRAKDLIVF